jgi:hypothetical protein
VHGYQHASGPPDPREVAQRRARLREQFGALLRQPSQTSSEIELSEIEPSDPDRRLFVELAEAERRAVAARRKRDDLREQVDAIVTGRAAGTQAERATRLRELRDRDADAEIELSDAERLFEAGDARCDPARARQHGRRVAAAQRELAAWESAREEKLQRMRELQRQADAIHAELLGVDGLQELAQRRAAVEKLASGRR